MDPQRVSGLFRFVDSHRQRANHNAQARQRELSIDQSLGAWRGVDALSRQSNARKMLVMQAKGEAVRSIPLVVYAVYEAFDTALKRQGMTAAMGSAIFFGASTTQTVAVAQDCNPHFETYIALFRKVLGDEAFQAMCRQSCGLDTDRVFGWLSEVVCGKPSIVPFPYNASNFRGKTLFMPLLYGSRVDVGGATTAASALTTTVGLRDTSQQRYVVLVNGKIEARPGIFMQPQGLGLEASSSDSSGLIKFIGLDGSPTFGQQRITARFPTDHSFVLRYLADLEACGGKEALEAFNKFGHFLPFPDSEKEDLLFQAALLEVAAEMGCEASASSPFQLLVGEEQQQETEDVDGTQTEVAPARTVSWQEAADNLYEQCLRAEWEKRQQAVIDGAVEGRQRKPQPKTAKKNQAAAAAQKDAVEVVPVFQVDQARLDEIKRMGRLKYRHVARFIMEILKERSSNIVVRVFKRGSHHVLHIFNKLTGQSGGKTQLLLHAGDRTVSGGEAASDVEQVMRLSAAPEEPKASTSHRRVRDPSSRI